MLNILFNATIDTVYAIVQLINRLIFWIQNFNFSYIFIPIFVLGIGYAVIIFANTIEPLAPKSEEKEIIVVRKLKHKSDDNDDDIFTDIDKN